MAVINGSYHSERSVMPHAEGKAGDGACDIDVNVEARLAPALTESGETSLVISDVTIKAASTVDGYSVEVKGKLPNSLNYFVADWMVPHHEIGGNYETTFTLAPDEDLPLVVLGALPSAPVDVYGEEQGLVMKEGAVTVSSNQWQDHFVDKELANPIIDEIERFAAALGAALRQTKIQTGGRSVSID